MGRPDVTIMAYQGGNRATLRTRIGTFGEYTPGTNVTTDFASAKLSARRSILEGGGVGQPGSRARTRVDGSEQGPPSGPVRSSLFGLPRTHWPVTEGCQRGINGGAFEREKLASVPPRAYRASLQDPFSGGDGGESISPRHASSLFGYYVGGAHLSCLRLHKTYHKS